MGAVISCDEVDTAHRDINSSYRNHFIVQLKLLSKVKTGCESLDGDGMIFGCWLALSPSSLRRKCRWWQE
jgi:hypothetical protein